MRAKVIFTDGFHTSPTIETDHEDLKARMREVLAMAGSVSQKATTFLVKSIGNGHPATIHNTPGGRTFGVTMAMIENQEFWPGKGEQAGIFLGRTDNESIQYWGGLGFEGTPEFTKAIVQTLEKDEDDTTVKGQD